MGLESFVKSFNVYISGTDIEVPFTEYMLSRSILSRYSKDLTNRILNDLKSKENNVITPTIDRLIEDIPSLKQEYINYYQECIRYSRELHGKSTSKNYFSAFSDSVMAVQGALLSEPVFGVDLNTGSVDQYSSTDGESWYVIEDPSFKGGRTDVLSENRLNTVVQQNRMGNVCCLKARVAYSRETSTTDLTLLSNLKKVKNNEDMLFIPVLYSILLLKTICGLLDSGNCVIRVDDSGATKVRYVNSGSVEMSIEPVWYPLEGYAYLPVIGAPITTTGLTKISIFTLMDIRPYNDVILEEPNSSKTIRNHMADIEISRKIDFMLHDDGAGLFGLESTIRNFLPKAREYFSEGLNGITWPLLSHYLHSLSGRDLEKAYSILIKYLHIDLSKYAGLFTGEIKVVNTSVGSLHIQRLIRDNLCVAILMGNEGNLYSIPVTNNRSVLSAFYGNDYFKTYEQLSYRVYRSMYLVKQLGVGLEEALKDNNVTTNPEIVRKLRDSISHISNLDELNEAAKTIVYNGLGKVSRNESYESKNILVRTLEGYLKSVGNTENYYRYIKPQSIQRLVVIKTNKKN